MGPPALRSHNGACLLRTLTILAQEVQARVGALFLPIGNFATGKCVVNSQNDLFNCSLSIEVPDPGQRQRLQYAGSLARQVFLNLSKAYKNLFLRGGMDGESLDEWIKKVDEGMSKSHWPPSSQNFKPWS